MKAGKLSDQMTTNDPRLNQAPSVPCQRQKRAMRSQASLVAQHLLSGRGKRPAADLCGHRLVRSVGVRSHLPLHVVRFPTKSVSVQSATSR